MQLNFYSFIDTAGNSSTVYIYIKCNMQKYIMLYYAYY